MRYRKGPKGLYYTNGKLDNNYYNDMYAPYWERLWQSTISLIKDLPMLWEEYLWPGLQGLFYLLVLPVIPFIRTYNAKRYVQKNFANRYKETPSFPKDYYEEI